MRNDAVPVLREKSFNDFNPKKQLQDEKNSGEGLHDTKISAEKTAQKRPLSDAEILHVSLPKKKTLPSTTTHAIRKSQLFDIIYPYHRR